MDPRHNAGEQIERNKGLRTLTGEKKGQRTLSAVIYSSEAAGRAGLAGVRKAVATDGGGGGPRRTITGSPP